ncbi:protein virilizer isoform X1 [Neodiprion fabricii]|uniref:protein virilizer isoform X1 n=1 Tax=Neodiprion fabricii TaxID=2872261 RepID=UPI001ED96C2F|nr:protein virilizer isoform X1 [Neodiprion fabricii]
MENVELLFFDTFSHDISEELNLDLVQFPKPVFISEVRIIPLGARVQADFPGGVRLGATNPSQFEIEFFVNDLSKPGASTFESLGGLEYKQNIHIQLECERKQIPTDGLVLRGWYTTITLAVYGTLTKSLSNPPEVPTPAANSTVCVSGSEETPECTAQIPEQSAEWYYENPQPANSTETCVAATPSPPVQPIQTVDPSRNVVPEPVATVPTEQWEEHPGNALIKMGKRPSSPPTESLVSLSPESISAEEEDGDRDGIEIGTVEPFEPILSDEDIMADDAPPSVDYECDVTQVLNQYSLIPPDLLDLNKPVLPTGKKSDDGAGHDRHQKMLCAITKSVLNFINASGQEKETFVHNCETMCLMLNNMDLSKDDFKDFTKVVDAGLDMDLARSHPQPAYKVRHIKVGVRLAEALCKIPHGPAVLLDVKAPSRLLYLCMQENVALPVKLSALRALDAALISPEIVAQFSTPNSNLYKLALEMLDAAKLARLKYALSSLLRKIHVYELLAETTELTESVVSELTNAYMFAPTLMSQPKRQLPASARIEFEREPGTHSHLIAYFSHHKLMHRVLLALISSKSNVCLIKAIRHFLLCLAETTEGLLYLLDIPEITKMILRALHYDRPGLGCLLAWRLQVVQCLISLQSSDWTYLKKLHSFLAYPEGLRAIIAVVPMDKFIEILLPYLSDVTLGEFAAEIISMIVRYSDHVEIFQNRATDILEKSRNHPVLREVTSYLTIAMQRTSWDYSDVSSLVIVIRKHSNRAPSLPGELVTACRILVYLIFPSKNDSDPMEPYVELKHCNALTQLFAAGGLPALLTVMTNIAEFYEQPYLHRAALTGRRGLALAALLLPCVKLIGAMLDRLVKCMGTDFKDLTAVVPLLGVYSLVEAMPSTRFVHNLSNEIVETLLIFTRAVDADGSGNVAKSLWTQMLGEVLKMVALSPCNFVPGIKLLERLLPPILNFKEIAPEDVPRMLGQRKLWSAHLQAQATNLTETLRLLCNSWNIDLLTLLSSVCKQLSDLAAPTALLVGRCLLDSVLAATPLEKNIPILVLLGDLVRHAPLKATLLTLTSPAARAQVKSDQRYPPVIELLCSTLKTTSDNFVQREILDILVTLCDSTLSLIDLDASETFEKRLTHSVPSKEPLLAIITTLIEILANAPKYQLDILKHTLNALISLTAHNYGLYHVKSCLESHPAALFELLEHVSNLDDGDENKKCVSGLTVTFLESLISCKLPTRTLFLRVQQLASVISWGKTNHPLEQYEDTKDLVEALKNVEQKEEKESIPEMLEPLLPTPEALLNQFSQRSFGLITRPIKRSEKLMFGPNHQPLHEIAVDLLTLATELLPADFNLLSETQRLCTKAPPNDTNQSVQPKAQIDNQDNRDPQKSSTSTAKTKQPFVTPMRGRAQFTNSMRGGPAAGGVGRGADPFRSRPPNTSRPPSLHVDDFVALETCGAQPTGPTGYNKISIRGPCPSRGVMVGSGGRGRPWLPETRPPYLR